MTILRILLAIGLIPFVIALILNLPRARKAMRLARGHYLLCFAWLALALSQARFIAPEMSGNEPISMSAGEYTQVIWMALALFITFILLLRARLKGGSWRLPFIGLAVYAFLGLATAAFAPVPLLSAYKASQVFVVAIFSIVAFSYLMKTGQTRLLLEFTYVMLTLVMVSTAIGGLLFPQLAFIQMYTGGGGTFGSALHCIAPQIHQNGLGLLAAIMVVVSARRAFEKEGFTYRFYHVSLALLSFFVLFAAQARTSLVSLMIALLMMSLMIRRLRWLSFVMVAMAMLAVSYYVVTDQGLGVEEDVASYFRRGQTDQQIQTMSGRTVLWSIGMNMIADKPVLGHGFQTGARVDGIKYGLLSTNMHSSHLQVLVDSGLLGYFFWLLFVVPIAWRVIKSLVRRHLPERTEVDRFHIEAALIVFMVLFRSLNGHVFVAHDFNLLVYIALFLGVTGYLTSKVVHPVTEVRSK